MEWWNCGMIEWWNDIMIDWWNDGMMEWLNDRMMEWWNDEMINDWMIEWWNDGMMEWRNDRIIEWSNYNDRLVVAYYTFITTYHQKYTLWFPMDFLFIYMKSMFYSTPKSCLESSLFLSMSDLHCGLAAVGTASEAVALAARPVPRLPGEWQG